MKKAWYTMTKQIKYLITTCILALSLCITPVAKAEYIYNALDGIKLDYYQDVEERGDLLYLRLDDGNSPTADYNWTTNLTTTGTGRFDGGMLDSTSALSIDSENRLLYYSDGTTVIFDWTGMVLSDFNSADSLDWYQRYAYDVSEVISIDWQNRRLYSNDGIDIVLDWNTAGTAEFGDSIITTTGDIRLLSDSNQIELGLASDATIGFDGDSLNIIANAVTGTDKLDITSAGIESNNGLNINGTLDVGGTMLDLVKTNYNLSTASQTQFAMRSTPRANVGGNRAMQALQFDTRYTGSQTQTGTLAGVLGQIYHSGTGDTGASKGVGVEMYLASNATASVYDAFNSIGSIINTNTGTITFYRDYKAGGVDAEDGTVASATNFYGAAHRKDTGSLTTAYGLRLEAQTVGGTNWQIYSDSGDHYMGADNSKITMGTAGATDSYMQFGGTNLEVYSSGAIDLSADINIYQETDEYNPQGLRIYGNPAGAYSDHRLGLGIDASGDPVINWFGSDRLRFSDSGGNRQFLISYNDLTTGDVGFNSSRYYDSSFSFQTPGNKAAIKALLMRGNGSQAYAHTGFYSDNPKDVLDVGEVILGDTSGNLRNYGNLISSNAYIADITDLGVELVSNGDFGSGTDWVFGTGWALSAGTGRKGTDGNGTLSQTVPLTVGKVYRISWDASAFDVNSSHANFLIPSIGGVTLPNFRTADTFVYTFVAASTADLVFTSGYGALTNLRATLDNISVKEITGGDLTISGGNIYTPDDDLRVTCGTDKTVVLVETVYKDINIAGYLLTKPVSSAPGIVSFIDEAGADTTIETYGFAVGELVHGGFELQHDYKEGTDLTFHVHWQGIAAPSGTDNVQWRLNYIVMRGGATLDAAVVFDSPDTAIDTQYEVYKTNFAAITGTNFLIEDQFMFTLTRVASTGDAYAGEALIATAGIHYQVDTLGSRTISAK